MTWQNDTQKRQQDQCGTTNDVIWAELEHDAGNMVEFSQDKFSQEEMIFRAQGLPGIWPRGRI